jgi:hypothetical protein
MARRASSSINPGVLLGGAAAVIIAVVGGKMMLGGKTQSFGDVAPLDVQEFLANGNSLRGNVYVVEGTIDERFFRSNSQRHIVSVRLSTPGAELVPIEITPEFSHMNIEREQRYSFLVRFREGGIPVATGINRL